MSASEQEPLQQYSAQAPREHENLRQPASTVIPVEFFIPDLCAPRPVLVMVLLAELMVLAYTLSSSTLPGFNWELCAIASLLVQWVVLLSAAMLCPLRRVLSRVSLPLATLASLLVVLCVTGLASILTLLFNLYAVPEAVATWWVLRNMVVAALLTCIVLRYFYLQQQLRHQEKLELQSRLDSLRARIRPHFLFNTLNSIASLIVTRPDAAEQAVEDLAELFRASLKESEHSVTVADELRLCEMYLGIEKLRLEERLHINWEVDPSVVAEPMPSLLLQPLVENAIYHGVARLPDGGAITVSVRPQDGNLHVRVENPVPSTPDQSAGHRMALANIEQRLQALYGEGAGMAVSPGEHDFRVDLHYPLGAIQ